MKIKHEKFYKSIKKIEYILSLVNFQISIGLTDDDFIDSQNLNINDCKNLFNKEENILCSILGEKYKDSLTFIYDYVSGNIYYFSEGKNTNIKIKINKKNIYKLIITELL